MDNCVASFNLIQTSSMPLAWPHLYTVPSSLEADWILFSSSFSALKNQLFIFRLKKCTNCVLFFIFPYKYGRKTKIVSALTQLTHERPRSSVNMYTVQPLSALGTNVGGLWAVSGRHRNPGWNRWTHSLTFAWPCSITQPHTAFVFRFRFQPKMADLFRFCLFLAKNYLISAIFILRPKK